MKTNTNIKIQLRKLHKSFGKKIILNGLDLNVYDKESFVVIGPSGVGKSVLLKCMLGLLPIDRGSIIVDGDETSKLTGKKRNEFLKKFAIVFQGGALFDSMKIWENVAFGLTQGQGMPVAEAKKLAIEKLELVGMNAAVGEQRPNELSGGMQKRVAIARAIIMEPEILLFDEPTAGLDPVTASLINQLIRRCHDELNITTFTITHDMSTVHTVADRVGMLNEGKIIWEGTLKEVAKSDNHFVQQFIHQKTFEK
jgi:phospholipid/cholesterol/gamma-HCH transport system ATP-binding protein